MSESEASLRGYASPRRLRSERARMGWERRYRAGYRPHGRMVANGRSRQEGLALHYRIQQISRDAFATRFAELQEQRGIRYSQRGMLTCWQVYASSFTVYRFRGQDFKTTNCDRARSLQARGRARGVRTVQRAHRTLAAMGLLHSSHVRRGGARRGNRDCLRIRFLSFVTPPAEAGAGGHRPLPAPAPATAGYAGRGGRPAAPARAAPPNGGSVGFADDQLQHPEGGATGAAEIAALEAQLALPFEQREGQRNTVTLQANLAWARLRAARE